MPNAGVAQCSCGLRQIRVVTPLQQLMIQWLEELCRSQQRTVTLGWSQVVDLSPCAGYRPQPWHRTVSAITAEELHLQAFRLTTALRLSQALRIR
jgi:hypothetical protein